MPERPIYLRLDEAAFRQLVAGETVELRAMRGEGVRLILAEIGWDRLRAAIDDAERARAPRG